MNRIRRRAASTLGIFALLAGVLGVVAPAQAAGTHTITVQLNPVREDYLVDLECDGGYEEFVSSDASGRAVFTNVPADDTCEAHAMVNIFFASLLVAQGGDYVQGDSDDFATNADKTVAVDLEANSNFKCTAPSTVNGDPAIGHAVSVGVPGFTNGTLDPNSLEYLWFRLRVVNGHLQAHFVQGSLNGPSPSTYTPTAADAGYQLVVIVFARSSGSPSASTVCDYSPSGAVHQAGTPAPGAPGIQGKGKVGKKLTAVAPPLAGATVGYQWFQVTKKKGKNNRLVTKPINGATSAIYKVKQRNKGKKLFVAVTYTKAPDGPTTVISGAKKIR